MILPTQTAARKSIHETPFYIPPHKRAIYAANTDKEAEHFLTVKPAGPVALTIMSMGMVRLTISEIRKRPAEFLWDHLAEVLSFPCKSWQLFTGDVKVPPEMIFSLLDFSFSGIDLRLVALEDTVVWTYILRPHAKELPWRRCQPCSDVDPLSLTTYKALALWRFNMVTPFPEFHAEPVWKKYLEQRIRLEARQTYSPPLPGTKISRYNVFSESHDAPFDILCKAGINESFGNWFCDGVLVVHGEYYNTPRETTGKVFVRIYPLHTLNMIEIGFYHHKVRGNEREPHFKYDGCALGFRYVLPDEEPYTYAMIRTLFTRSMRKMFLPERNGFTNIYYGNQHRGRPDENDSEWSGSRGSLGIDGDDLDLLNDAFQLPDTFKSNRTMAWKKVAFKRALACRFLLSTVTVDPGVDSFGRVNEKLMGNAIGPFPWVLGGVDNWFARKVSFWCRGKWGRTKWKDTIEIRG